MDDGQAPGIGRLALAVAGVAVGTALCLGAFFAVGGPFGTLNDVGNGAVGVLSAALAWRMRRVIPQPIRPVAIGLALGGGALTVVGSTLVTSGTTGFFFAGLVSSVGFAGIGSWLLALSRSADAATWPRIVRLFATAAGALMVLGVAVTPGIFMRVDDMATAPSWIWVAFLSWIGVYMVYPAWALRFGAGVLGGTNPRGIAHVAGKAAR